MEKFIKKGVWTIIGWNGKFSEHLGQIVTAKDKYRAGMQYQLLSAIRENVVVFDNDGEYCDPCEL